jgi:hypothetical protein
VWLAASDGSGGAPGGIYGTGFPGNFPGNAGPIRRIIYKTENVVLLYYVFCVRNPKRKSNC